VDQVLLKVLIEALMLVLKLVAEILAGEVLIEEKSGRPLG
jgi:hypothetical protein